MWHKLVVRRADSALPWRQLRPRGARLCSACRPPARPRALPGTRSPLAPHFIFSCVDDSALVCSRPQDHDASGRAHLDFTDFGATRALTAALLREDFGLRWWIPDGTLCPTLTNRTNYIHWLEDLLALSAPRGAQRVRGVDIGTGASAIYALLGAAMNQWCAHTSGDCLCFVDVRVCAQGVRGD